MTGHHVFTRSWYEYGSHSKNPGTYTVELTDRFFGHQTHDVIYHKLNPSFAGTQPTLAGYSQEDSMLRVFNPTPESVIVARSYFANDEITGRGMVQYSYGLLFSGSDKDNFLVNPKRAFSIRAYEPYDEFVKRVPDDGLLPYSNKYDPVMEDYAGSLTYETDKWKRLGFSEDIFVKFFVSLGRAITSQKGDPKVAVMSADNNGEDILLATLFILPHWQKRKFGGISTWAGALDRSGKSPLGGIQLVCYSNDKPPHDTSEVIIDLTGTNAHKNVPDISYQEEIFARWMWKNINIPDKILDMTRYMFKNYKSLLDRMPFEISAHCFWLWLTFVEEYKEEAELSFETKCMAITSLVSAFGRKLEEHFRDAGLLQKILASFGEELPFVAASELNRETIKALCALASGDTTIGNVKVRSFIKPVFSKLEKAEHYDALEPIVVYYSKFFKDEKPKELINEALPFFSKLTACSNKKIADEAAAVLGRYASACAVAKLKGINPEQRMSQFNIIADLFRKQGRQINLDYASFEELPKNAAFSVDFYEIETATRERFNMKPPGAKQLQSVQNWLSWLPDDIKEISFRSLLDYYWRADELADAAQRAKYVKHLFDNKVLGLYVKRNVGKDFIRDIYLSEFNAAMSPLQNAAPDEKIRSLIHWREVFSDVCGFADSDLVFEALSENVSNMLLVNIENLIRTVSPKAMEDLQKLLSRGSLAGGHASPLLRVINAVCKIDMGGKVGGEFSASYGEWADNGQYIMFRIDYWLSSVGSPPPEWALTRAVIEMNTFNLWQNNQLAAQKYIEFIRCEPHPKNQLESLYKAIQLISESRRYDIHTSARLFDSIKAMIGRIVSRLSSEGMIDVLIATGDSFVRLYDRPMNYNEILVLGAGLSRHINNIYKSKNEPIPFGVLNKFNPTEFRAVGGQKRRSPVKPVFFVSSCVIFFVGILSGVILLLVSEGEFVRTIYSLPFPMIIAGGVSAILAFLLTFLRLVLNNEKRRP